MADRISFRLDTRQFTTGIGRRVERMPGAARWTVREAGRVVARTAKTRAPVLKDSTRASYSTIRARQRRGLQPAAGTFDRPIPSLLKASIRPSRRLTQIGAVFSIKVGPRGQRVHLYAQKEERRAGYMAAGHAAGEAGMERIARQAFDRVWKE